MLFKNKRWIGILVATIFWMITFYALEENMENSYLKWFVFGYFCVVTSYLSGRRKAIEEFFKDNIKDDLRDEYHDYNKQNI